MLILDDSKWTVPTFSRSTTVVDDSKDLIALYKSSAYRLIPIELYLSQDQGFEFSTYICLVEEEFISEADQTFCWANMSLLPKNLHSGLKSTLASKITQTKIDTILLMEKSA